MAQLTELTLQANSLLLALLIGDFPSYSDLHYNGLDDYPLVSATSEDITATKLVGHVAISTYCLYLVKFDVVVCFLKSVSKSVM